MGKEIPAEVRDKAEDLYIVDGMTYAQVATATGVSESQLMRWGKEGDWGDRRREYRAALRSIRRDTVTLRQKLIQSALESLDPQAVYAVARIEAIAAKKAAPEAETVPVEPAEPVKIDTPADAVTALKVGLERKINAMLATGDIDLKALKDLKQSIELMEAMEAKYQPEEPAQSKQAIDPETMKKIREQVYGLH